MLRSQQSGYDRNACVICQRNDGVLHKISTIPMGQKLFECASLIQKKDVGIRLNSVCNPADAVADDVLYHRKCYVYLKRQAWKDISSELQDVVHKARVVANIEILNLVEYKLSQEDILNMNTIHATYKSMLLENGIDENTVNDDSHKKYLKHLITRTN